MQLVALCGYHRLNCLSYCGGDLVANVVEHGRLGRRAFVAGTTCTLAGLGRGAFAWVHSLNERMQGDIAPVHDPCIIEHASAYYVFSTTSRPDQGGFIACRRSSDLVRWEQIGFAFSELPAWAHTEVPRARGLWAPDVAYVNGRYHLYYSVSSFGSNHSAIGLATNETLDPGAANYRWVDQGPVVRSRVDDDYNAIDPQLFIDRDDEQWLVFGSFWSGIKITRIDPSTGKPPANAALESLAARKEQPPAIEAPFLVAQRDFNYLFVSLGFCCRGVKSDYHVVCGRSQHVLGPYLDADGRPLLEGGGTLVVRGDERFKGTGHSAFLRDGEQDYLVYHAYDAQQDGRATLRISPITWTADGWPQVEL